ncbi:MAG TPA: chromate efflux transporter [Thermomicrobiales bacterium]|nr:chromate efflux transporter [Thermomicrobiales bacterium]
MAKRASDETSRRGTAGDNRADGATNGEREADDGMEGEVPAKATPTETGSLKAVALLSLKLGCTAFGGPAAHIAMLRHEVVERRRWMSDRHFLDLLGATNLIPGPNSTEMVIHVGYEVAGWPGLAAAGALFIVPAASITLAFAWLYLTYGATPAGEWLLYGVKPVVAAVILQAVWSLGRAAFRSWPLRLLAAAVFALGLGGASDIVLLLGSGALFGVARGARQRIWPSSRGWALLPPAGGVFAPALAGSVAPYSPLTLFLIFLKIGATLYGSGYVLLAYLQQDFIDRLGWLTNRQLLDAVAVGQFTPGPVSSTATFVGYVVGGVPGAILATIGIFLPAFLLVGIVNPLLPRIRRSPWSAGFLDGVNAAAIGLMAAVLVSIGRDAIVDPLTAALAVAAALLLVRFKVNSAYLIAGGAAVGLLVALLPR